MLQYKRNGQAELLKTILLSGTSPGSQIFQTMLVSVTPPLCERRGLCDYVVKNVDYEWRDYPR